jgi:hypothetical protein
MTSKIKVFVGFLALITVFSVYSVFNSFSKKTAVNFVNTAKNVLSFTVEQDVDKDGLNNHEESYWNTDFKNPDTDGDGFKDGEEVTSGHDPLIPGPDDLLNADNLTSKLSNLTFSGLYEGSLELGGSNYNKSLNDMALAIMDDATVSLNPEIDTSKLRIVSSSKKNQEAYLDEISDPFEKLLLTFGDELNNLQQYLEIIGNNGFSDKGLVSYFQTKEQQLQEILNKSSSLAVPENWTQNHTRFLGFVKNLQVANRSIARGSEDPVKASAALNNLGDAFENFSNMINPFVDKIQSENLNNPFFKSLLQ